MSDTISSDPQPGGPAGGSGRSGGAKRGLVIGGVVAVLAIGGGAAWAATSFFGQGEQPAQALPATTLGYASVDLDPAGGQKLEAVEMLRKFPAFKEQIGLETDDDIREKVVSELIDSGECEGLDYAEDVEPWLGQRAAVAAVDGGGEEPLPAVVLQVDDADAAEEGLTTVAEACGGGEFGSSIEGDWAVLSETQDDVDTIVKQTDEATLDADEDYQRWIDEAGDPGVMSLYAAPEAGKVLLDLFGAAASANPMAPAPEEMPEEMRSQVEDFQGAAATVRFSDGSLEVELAADAGDQTDMFSGAEGSGEVVSSLPADTAAALGVSLPEGWSGKVMERIATSSGGAVTEEQLASELETNLGVTPEDLETALGESFALALSPDFSVESMMASSGPESLPLGLKVQGDSEEIEGVLDKMRTSMGPMSTLVDSQTEGDYVVVGPNAGYRDQLAGGDGLGDAEEFSHVVEDADEASSVLFVNFNGDWVTQAAEASGDPRVADNLEPLAAFGLSAEVDDEVARGILRVTTD